MQVTLVYCENWFVQSHLQLYVRLYTLGVGKLKDWSTDTSCYKNPIRKSTIINSGRESCQWEETATQRRLTSLRPLEKAVCQQGRQEVLVKVPYLVKNFHSFQLFTLCTALCYLRIFSYKYSMYTLSIGLPFTPKKGLSQYEYLSL